MHLSFTLLECELPSTGFPRGMLGPRRPLITFRDGVVDDHGFAGSGLVRISGSVCITYGSSEILKVVDEGVFSDERVQDPKTMKGWPRNEQGEYTPVHSAWAPVTVITHASKICAIQEAEKKEVDE